MANKGSGRAGDRRRGAGTTRHNISKRFYFNFLRDVLRNKPGFRSSLLDAPLQSGCMPFPTHRPRRLRRPSRSAASSGRPISSPRNFILPLFVVPGEGVRNEISSMPGNYQLSIDELVKECAECAVARHRRRHSVRPPGEQGRDGFRRLRPRRHRAARHPRHQARGPRLLVMTDVCNCEYTSHGHCGKVVDGDVDNDTRWSGWPRPRSPTRAPEPTSWRRPT